MEVAVPQKFDPHLVVDQLGRLQQSPNLISSYVNCLTARFRASREISYIKKLEEYYLALAAGMTAQLSVLDLEEDWEDKTDIENRALRRKISRRTLERELAKIETDIDRYRSVGSRVRNQEKNKDPYQRSYKQTEKKLIRSEAGMML